MGGNKTRDYWALALTVSCITYLTLYQPAFYPDVLKGKAQSGLKPE